MLDKFNDNEGVAVAYSAEPRGRAALLLVESLMHNLIARSAISLADAVEIIDVASDVEADHLAEMATSNTRVPSALTLLMTIRESFALDLR